MGKLVAVQGCTIECKTQSVTVASFQITTPPQTNAFADNKPIYAGTLSVVATGITMGNFQCPTATFTILPQNLYATINNQYIIFEGNSGVCVCVGTDPQGATTSITFNAEITVAGQTNVEVDTATGDISGIITTIDDLNRQVLDLTGKLATANTEIINLNTEISKLTSSLADANAEIEKQQGMIATMQTTLTEQDKEIQKRLLTSQLGNEITSISPIITDIKGTIQSNYSYSNYYIKTTILELLPNIDYSVIDPSHNTETYYKNLLKWICKNYPNRDYKTLFIATSSPNSREFVFINIYNTNQLQDELPQYSTGFAVNTSGSHLFGFGTSQYVYESTTY